MTLGVAWFPAVGTPTVTGASRAESHLVQTALKEQTAELDVIGTPLLLEQPRSFLERWIGAWPRTEEQEPSDSTTTPTVLERQFSRPLELNPPSAWVAAQQLRRWLGITFDDLSRITRVGASTFHSWNRPEVTPRPSKVRGLWQLHSLTKELESRLGATEAFTWLRSGRPSPLDLMLDGQLDVAEQMARSSVLTPLPIGENRFLTMWQEGIDDEDTGLPVGVATSQARAATRPVKKGRPRDDT